MREEVVDEFKGAVKESGKSLMNYFFLYVLTYASWFFIN